MVWLVRSKRPAVPLKPFPGQAVVLTKHVDRFRDQRGVMGLREQPKEESLRGSWVRSLHRDYAALERRSRRQGWRLGVEPRQGELFRHARLQCR